MSELFKTRTKPEKVYRLKKSVALLSLHMLHYMMLREALPWGQVQIYNGEERFIIVFPFLSPSFTPAMWHGLPHRRMCPQTVRHLSFRSVLVLVVTLMQPDLGDHRTIFCQVTRSTAWYWAICCNASTTVSRLNDHRSSILWWSALPGWHLLSEQQQVCESGFSSRLSISAAYVANGEKSQHLN